MRILLVFAASVLAVSASELADPDYAWAFNPDPDPPPQPIIPPQTPKLHCKSWVIQHGTRSTNSERIEIPAPGGKCLVLSCKFQEDFKSPFQHVRNATCDWL